MEKRKIPQVEIINADDPAQLQDRINAVLMQHPDVTDITIETKRALIRYDITVELPDQLQLETGTPVIPDHYIVFTDSLDPDLTTRTVIELILPKATGRYCCECNNYEWGRGCPYQNEMVRNMDSCCEMFNVDIKVDDLAPKRVKQLTAAEINQIEMKEEA